MQITVNIPDELAARLQSQGLNPEGFVEELLAHQTVNPERDDLIAHRREQLRLLTQEMARYSGALPEYPDESFSREWIYKDSDR